MRALALTAAAIAAVAALSFAEAASAWSLVARASDRNTRTPDATILSEEVTPNTWTHFWDAIDQRWVHELVKPKYRVVTQSTRPGNRLTWEVTCYIHNGSYSSTRRSRGRAWPGAGKHVYAIKTPTVGSSGLSLDDDDANCFATISLDAPWGRTRTIGVWLQAS